MKQCAILCKQKNVACPNSNCRQWIDYGEDFNCALISVDENGAMTLRDIAKREGVSFVRIQQIEKKAIIKLKKRMAKHNL